MSATDSASSLPAHHHTHTSFGRSILSLRHHDQIHNARKALTDLTILMLDDKDSAAAHRCNRSFGTTFGRGPTRKRT